jgi:hypothetical protein
LGGSQFQVIQGKKVSKTPSQWLKTSGAHAYHLSDGGLQSRLAWAKKLRPYLQIIRAKRTGAMAEVLEHLPREHEALSSNDSTSKN